MARQSLERISRGMTAVLRHGVGGARVDEHGWLSLEELSSNLTKLFKKPVTTQQIIEVLERDEVGRYELDLGGGRVRALYGHSIPVKIPYLKTRPGEVKLLYHGTTVERLAKIAKEGLRPLNRLWVHMYSLYELAAARSLRRKGEPVVLVIDATGLTASGYGLFKAGKYVYVSKYVPSRFIKEIRPVARG